MEHLPPIDSAAASRKHSAASSLSSKDRRALIIKCQLAIFSAYRIDQFADPEGFKNSLGAIFEGFPDEVIIYVSDPRTGIQRREEWPPSIAKVIAACEAHQDFLQRARTAKPTLRLTKPYEKPKLDMGKVFVPIDHPSYAKLVESWKLQPYKSPDGKEGVLAPAELLIDMGLMKKGAS
ncbi:MAG: hypothetical protein KGJ13_11300 [Patescibacteria group bacterium]|nr:hypothetical protein [Patescibacteria group bacterium]